MASELLKALNLPELQDEFKDAFPVADPGIYPLGDRVLCQIRSVKEKSSGGIILAQETKQDSQWNTQVARIIALGSLAFCNRSTGKPWPEGKWVDVGDFVRIPRWGGDRWEVSLENGDQALFVIFRDIDLIGKVLGDPTKVKDYIL